ncbi:MAG: DnaB-like helicase C-terminal domain-containing protein [Acidimicrobiia bacterium]
MTTTLTVRRLGRGAPQSALATLAEMRQAEPLDPPITARATGFTPLDDVLGGGVRPGELFLVGGKPGVGKTIACLQWARSMARRGATTIYLCYEHDQVTLLTRLLSCELGELAIASGRPYDMRLEELQAQLRDVASGALTLRETLDSDRLLTEAQRRLAEYGDRLIFFQASGSSTDIPAISDLIARYDGEPLALFVDYLQKVPVIPDVRNEAERVSRVTEGLKELALDRNISVFAIAAADQVGLASRRLHLHHFRGSTALAYEADAVVVMNDKADIVSRVHIVSSPVRLEEFRRQVVFSVEKNRSGVVGAELEFTKDFPNYRFEPHGSWVTERLWSENSIEL